MAIDARVQCVASGGVDSNLATSSSPTCPVVILAGLPGRRSSTNPSSHSSQNRERHFPTLDTVTPTTAATSMLDKPAAHLKTIQERNTNT